MNLSIWSSIMGFGVLRMSGLKWAMSSHLVRVSHYTAERDIWPAGQLVKKGANMVSNSRSGIEASRPKGSPGWKHLELLLDLGWTLKGGLLTAVVSGAAHVAQPTTSWPLCFLPTEMELGLGGLGVWSDSLNFWLKYKVEVFNLGSSVLCPFYSSQDLAFSLPGRGPSWATPPWWGHLCAPGHS